MYYTRRTYKDILFDSDSDSDFDRFDEHDRWGNAYKNNIEPLVILQKNAIRIITFSPYRSHTSHILKKLNLLQFADIINLMFILLY